MSTHTKIQSTKNYRLFGRSDDNRPLDIKKHKKLQDSMKRYGFLKCFPIVCYRNSKSNLIVKDGQHRLTIAESLGLPVHWVEEAVDFDVAIVNSTPKAWALNDYARKYAANGSRIYQEILDFVESHGVPIGRSVALLSGVTSFSACQNSFYDGSFKIKDRKYADMVASVYGPIAAMSRLVDNSRFLEACMAVCRVAEFDPERMVHAAERSREKLVSYSTRDAYLQMLDDLYNYNRSKRVPLKFKAEEAMKSRNAINKHKQTAKQEAKAA